MCSLRLPILYLLMLCSFVPESGAQPSLQMTAGLPRLPAENSYNARKIAEADAGERFGAGTQAVFTLHDVRDVGNVTIMETSCDYDPINADGSINEAQRQAVAREYFKGHADQDFLVLLTSFDFAMSEPGAKGFYQPVKNDVHGIGLPIFDNSARFGSAGRLQGLVDLGNLSELAGAPFGPKLAATVAVLSHEILHRFGAYVRFKLPDGGLSRSLLGRSSAHWSNLLSSRGSVMYGNQWNDNGNGTFTAIGALNGYSPLDLYLMGMLPKEKVPPMTLIDNPSLDGARFSKPGETISGTAKTVTMDDIVAAEGPRIPDAATARKKFGIGFVLLVKSGEPVEKTALAVETLRGAFAGRFARLTRGLGSIAEVPPSLQVTLDPPCGAGSCIGPDLSVTGTVINSTGADTAVTVNGMKAEVIGDLFVANRVPIHEGSNILTVSASDSNGLAATAARSVTAAAGHFLRIVSSAVSGSEPLTVDLQLAGSFDIAGATYNLTGPASARLSQEDGSMKLTALLGVEGTYTIGASAAGPDGKSYSDSVTITVLPKAELDNL
jgi:hypothetical protein